MLTGRSLIAGEPVDSAEGRFTAAGTKIEFEEASGAHVDRALDQAASASHDYQQIPAAARAGFLDRVAEEIEHIGDLIDVANRETALPPERLAGERARTAGQLRMFADLVREGSWVDARIDRAVPDRKPLAKPDIRRMLIPIGPVAVFGASNFPLAFSVAGGDTASALAAGCPVVVKAHPAHPATSELAAGAIVKAAQAAGMPPGIFSLIQSTRHDVATALVQHRHTRAVGFTGSLRAGRALFDAAARRPDPIPVYAEMGSVNPVFLLPGALAERAEAIADGLAASVTLGVGQFCTNPGVVVAVGTESFDRFVRRLQDLIRAAPPGTMLYPALLQSYETGLRRLSAVNGTCDVRSSVGDPDQDGRARPALFETSAQTFMQHRALSEEVFGPSTVVVRCGSGDEMAAVARGLEGQLTATIHGTPADLAKHAWLVSILQDKAGRLVLNGFPTGVEVCGSMQHGGPYPATTDSRTTSVGTAAINRFARPVAYQNFPQSALPVELQDANPRAIWRWVDGKMSKDALAEER
ncbi:MAG TPA: aldehyde dehydrogenase (NADP(+)) [Vicinamibacterales bacterium]|jgi:NADP-dependent aldehyde dehydrogenase|nr:aldehyde dehydrogenase (NADP(+)) [Vicinamibacterales bacterium]